MFDNLKIRNKLVLLVAGPIIIIVLLAALGAKSRQDTASKSREVERMAASARANSDVVHALQRESLFSTAFVASERDGWKSEVGSARKATDKIIVDALSRQRALAGTSASFRSAATLAADAADKLIYIRSAVDQGYRWDQVATTYRALQGTFLEVNNAIANNLEDPQVASDLRTGASLASFKATIAQQGAVLVGAAEQGGFTAEGSFALLEKAKIDEESESAILSSIADTDRKGEIRDALTSDDRIKLEEVRDFSLARQPDDPVTTAPTTIIEATDAVLDDLHRVEGNLYGQVIQRSLDSRNTAERAATFFILAAGVAIMAAVLAAALLGRRITRPLNHLTEAADKLSSEQMPRLVEWLRNPSEDEMAFELGALQPIEVETNDEIGKLASSFNDVQRVAGEVAAEQAALLRKGIGEMFVNLARRNQALLDRQIDFIDELERGEEDPDQLENLYRLDHLATRMRRNAESLLVLAGAEPPRRRGRPAPLANVVRAALAEVEDFGRIDLLTFDEILVASNVAADLAHLLSELMENATNFSPPETRVEVVGHRTKAEGYVISVTDHGIGMSNEQILDANEALAKPPLVGLALSRSLGFIVVGRLAGRHGVTVRMMSSPSGGVTAVVSIPPTLITDTPGLAGSGDAPLQEGAEAPARLKPVLEAPPVRSGAPAPLAFTPNETFGDPVAPAPAPVAKPALAPADRSGPTGPVARPTVQGADSDPKTGLPARRAKAGGEAELPDRRKAAADDAGEASADDLPEALIFEEPKGIDGSDVGAARLDGPPPAAPTRPARSGPARPPTPSRSTESDAKPFFLEEAQPPRLFGRAAEDAAPAAEAPAAERTGPQPPRRRKPAPAAAAAETAPLAVAGPAPLAARRPKVADEPAPAPVPTPAPVAQAAAPAAPSTTSAGLARRAPREGSGARTIPGSDVERGVSATRRSPDEVRNLLSRYRDGQQRARTEESVPAGSPDEKDANE